MTEASGRIGVEVRITGRVQGVCFRDWTRGEAERQGVAGWVRNEPDGSVRALFVGPRDRVSAVIERCRQGPPAARVSDVETEEVPPPGDVDDFRVTG